MPTLVAVQPFTYANRSLNVGDTFEASDMHAALLKLVGRAKDAQTEEPRPKRQYRRRDLTAEP